MVILNGMKVMIKEKKKELNKMNDPDGRRKSKNDKRAKGRYKRYKKGGHNRTGKIK